MADPMNDPMTDAICYAPATDLAERIRNGSLSPVTVVDAFLDRIDRLNPELNAYVTVCGEQARESARTIETRLEDGETVGPLCGVPVAIKDLTAVSGVRTTLGSPVFEDYVPEADDVVVSRLRDAGAIVLGKTNTPEFGRKTVTDNPVFGESVNPWGTDRVTGGSSGGSAAAVAAGLAPIALGSDAAGSIRIPSSACGVFGLMPDFGRVPNASSRSDAFQNVLPYTFRGPITRTVEDAAVMLEVIAGPNRTEPYSLPDAEGSYRDAVDGPRSASIGDVTIGYSPDFGEFLVNDVVSRTVENALDDLEAAGATVIDADLSFEDGWEDRHDALDWILQTRYVGLYEELKREKGVDLLETDLPITPEVRSRVRKGLELDTTTIAESRRLRTAVFDEITDALASVDVLVTPTLGRTAFDRDIDEPTVNGESVHLMHGWTLTWPLNPSGHPAASVPIGFDGDDLPIGMQVIGDRLADEAVVAVSAAIERERAWSESYPPAELGDLGDTE